MKTCVYCYRPQLISADGMSQGRPLSVVRLRLSYAHGLQEDYEGRDCCKQMICCRKRCGNGISGDTPDLFVALATVNCLHNLGRCRLGGLLHEHGKGTIGRKCVALFFFIDRCWTFGPWKAEGRYIVTHHASFVVTQFQVLSVGALTCFDHIFTQEWRSASSRVFYCMQQLSAPHVLLLNHHLIDWRLHCPYVWESYQLSILQVVLNQSPVAGVQVSLACPLARLLHGDASFLQAQDGKKHEEINARDGRFLNAPLNTQFVRLIPFYLSLPTVGPYWLRFGAQTSQSALEKKRW